jgi:hypothetical protein
MLGLRIQVQLEIADSVAAVRQERDRLVHLHSLRFEHLEQTPFGLGIVAIYKSESAAMKPPSSDGVLLGSLPVWLKRFDSERPAPQSLFSLLLQIESELRKRLGAILSFSPDSENSRCPKTLNNETLRTALATLNKFDAWAGHRPMRFSFSYRQKLPGVVVWAGKRATLVRSTLLGSRTTNSITPPFPPRLRGSGHRRAQRHWG